MIRLDEIKLERLHPRDVVLIRVPKQDEENREFEVRMRDFAQDLIRVTGCKNVFVLEEGYELSMMDDEQMRAEGWVRAPKEES